MKTIYYLLVGALLLAIIAFLAIRNVTVQNFLIDFDANRMWNNIGKAETIEGDNLIGIVCGSRDHYLVQEELNHAL